MSLAAGVAVAVAVLAARGPGGRSPRAVAGGATRVPGVSGVVGRSGAGAPRAAAARSWGAPLGRLARLAGRPSRAPAGDDLALLVTDVAARLRAGAEPGTAWRAVLGRPVPPTGPEIDDLGRSPAARGQAAAVVAAGRLATALGAPLAPLLDVVADELAAQAEAEGERRAALAGPRATAQVLTWLPVLGVLLGTAVGADPLAVLLDGSIGSAALAAGVALVLLGRGWTSRLANRAAEAGHEP